ncbi:MAG TPA: MFS transporter, partial [Marmoricola sp.]|nr:MFS transporter [Marmoricola sp.]
LRYRVPDPRSYEDAAVDSSALPTDSSALPRALSAERLGERLPGRFWTYVGLVGLLSCGVASFPLLAFHAQTHHLLSDAQIPILFAVAMAVDGASGLITGRLYDRHGPLVLLAVPIAAAVSAVAFTTSITWVWIGVAIWGVVNGVLDSTIKAVVTEIVPSARRAVGFGWLSLLRGASLLIAGGVLGAVYDVGRDWVIGVIVAANAAAFLGLAPLLARLDREKAT